MKSRIFDVVAFIAQRCHEQGNGLVDPDELRDELLDAGYEEDEVERGMAWLERLRREGVPWGEWEGLAPSSVGFHRVADQRESYKLSSEARGYLMRLERMGLLDAAQREVVYERALSTDAPTIGVEEVRLLVALLFESQWGTDPALPRRILEDELDLLLH